MQEQHSSLQSEIKLQPTAEVLLPESDPRAAQKLEAMRRLIDETYADLLAEDDELATEVAVESDVVEIIASPEVLTHKDRIERIGSNLAHTRRDR
jgi:hypothetical protein